MNQLPIRAAEVADDWLKIVAHLVRGAGLSEDDVRRILATLKNSEELRFVEAALRQWLVTQAERGAAEAATVEPPPATTAATACPTAELVVAHDAFDPHSERIRALRTELLMRQDRMRSSVLAVLSPGAGEGRSRLAAELAIVCAQLGEPTLLVDADLRRSRQHLLFQVENDHGLAQVLADGETPPMHGVRGLPQLSVLTSGTMPERPLEILSGARFGERIATWRQHYRHIILDTPPVAAFSDGLAVAMHCNSVILVSRAQQTRVHAGRELLRRLGTTPARVLGSVVNHF